MKKILLATIILASHAFADEQKIFTKTECAPAYEYYFLNRAIAHEDMISIRYLVEGGVDINGKGHTVFVQKCGGYYEYSSPVMMAVNNKEILEYLLKHGANPNIIEGEGFTPLDIARKNALLDIIELLEKHGAKQRKQL